LPPRQLAQLLGQRKGNHEIIHRQQQRVLPRQPLARVVVAARGAMAILARVITVTMILAVRAEIYLPAERFGAAVRDIRERAFVARRHARAELRQICRRVFAKDVGQRDALINPP